MPDRCHHHEHEPVEVLDPVTGRKREVGRICSACFADLPPGFGCQDCTWHEEATLAGHVHYYRIRPCRAHSDA